MTEKQSLREEFASRECFYVGGEYIDDGSGGFLMEGQMYVEKLTPMIVGESGAQKWPVVFIHGNGQSGINFLNKPNNTGPGFASHFLKKRYTVYIIDQTHRGRSPYLPLSGVGQTGATLLGVYPTFAIEQRFTATKKHMLWPQAQYHTQWEGTGEKNDPTFDAYYSTIVPAVMSRELQQKTMQTAGAALLDFIGPAILIGHSQGGIFPWLWADARPGLVKAILSLEPNGPPFREVLFGKDGKGDGEAARKYGIADIPLNFTHPTSEKAAQQDPKSPLISQIIRINDADIKAGEIEDCVLQCLPARKLINLRDVPTLLVTAEASYHAYYDRCTVKFLEQAGVEVEWLRLGDLGIHGNGHMFFLEKNSDEIAEVLEGWLSRLFSGK